MLAGYYRKSKKRFQKEAPEGYYVLSEEETNRERQYACKQFRNFPEEEKNKKCQLLLLFNNENFLNLLLAGPGCSIKYKKLKIYKIFKYFCFEI